MPFPDELPARWVTLHDPDPRWATKSADLAGRPRDLLPSALDVEHIGSTSVPDMPAKDCLDMMPVVAELDEPAIVEPMVAAGYRLRPEPWNRAEPGPDGRRWPKLVFAPPVRGRSVNVHARLAEAPTTRRALLFRDFLRADPEQAVRWVRFKTSLADAHVDLLTYGQVKAPAWELLMDLAEGWAADTGWRVPWSGS